MRNIIICLFVLLAIWILYKNLETFGMFCPVCNTLSQESCTNCANCGYCESQKKCMYGNSKGPSFGSCKNWTY